MSGATRPRRHCKPPARAPGADRMAPMRPATSVAPASDEREPRPALTSLAAGAGCGCKLPPGQLLSLVSQLAVQPDERLLVGSASSDDAAVFELHEGLALVQSVDFFTPLVDDAYDFGRIAAVNALSDLYAMGATPLTALNLVAFPLQLLGEQVLTDVLRGGAEVVAEAGAVLAGGHSIDDREPKYGLAVTGLVDPARMLTNAGGRAGDALVLTKPLGGARRNAEWADTFAGFAEDVVPWRRRLLADPATSGGLLVALDPAASGLIPGAVIGRLREGPAGTIAVH